MDLDPADAAIDLHCHTAVSFDGSVDPRDFCLLAKQRGLTHVAITDHDAIAGALRARDEAPDGLTVIVGQEVRTALGDVIALYIDEAIPSGQSLESTLAAIHAQGGLAGLPHPFDPRRPSVGVGEERPDHLRALAKMVDFVEIHNGRVRDETANAQAASLSRTHDLPGIAASDAHTAREIGRTFTVLERAPQGPQDLMLLLRRTIHLVVRQDADARGETAFRRIKRLLRARLI